MAKRKSSKKKGGDADGTSKVSQVDRGGAIHPWNMVRVLEVGKNGMELSCRVCQGDATEVWASNHDPDDIWNLCTACSQRDFGRRQVSPEGDFANASSMGAIENADAKDVTDEDVLEDVHAKDVAEDDSMRSVAVLDTSSEKNDEDLTDLCEESPSENSSPSLAETIPSTPPVDSSPIDHFNGDDPFDTLDRPVRSSECGAPSAALIHPSPSPFVPHVATPGVSTDQIILDAVPIESSTVESTVSAQPPEKWDVVRKLDQDVKVTCRVAGCRRRAVECWASNLTPDDEWNMCLKCIQEDFGLEEGEEDPATAPQTGNESVDIPAETPSGEPSKKCGQDYSTITPSTAEIIVVNSSYVSPDVDTEGDGEESWDLKKVMSCSDLAKEGTIKCGSETCTLAAAAVYCSTLSNAKWYTCLDCQVADYGGWPDKLEDIPLRAMTHEHKLMMAKKCSRLSSPVFPKFVESPIIAVDTTDSDTPPLHGTEQITSLLGTKLMSQPSAQAMAIHRKWQAAAETLGGSDARIVVDKTAAKKLIVDLLYDAFCPMNITQIHTALKAVVPSPVLKQCLDDMTLDKEDGANVFADSDDDEPNVSKKKPKPNSGDEFAGVLGFKAGRNANTSLYYVDHTKQKNNGNGLEFDARDRLYTDKSQAEDEHAKLKTELLRMDADTKNLNSQPTNEEAMSKLEADEAAMVELLSKVEDARKLKVNEKHKRQTKLRIQGMTQQWRKRRRICIDFLITMEEYTDGSISMKKCLAGEGQIDVESDEKALKDTKTFASNKLTCKKLKSVHRKPQSTQDPSSHIAADENFIGILLDSQGNLTRAYLDEQLENRS
jgi:hypothetical protein